MSSINQRLRDTIEAKKLSGRQVAIELEIDYRQFNNWLNQTKPSIEGLQKIIKYFPDINARWLLTGEGEMDLPEQGVTMEPSTAYKITRVDCPECISKLRTIAELEEYRRKYIECLEELAGKKKAG